MLIQTLHHRGYMVRTKFRILFLRSQFIVFGDKQSMTESVIHIVLQCKGTVPSSSAQVHNLFIIELVSDL